VIDPLFHPDSYGYRPGKSALDAVGQARQRCWQFDWVIDLDSKGFFDNIDHELLMRAVRKHAKDSWVVLYISRWLTAPAQDEEGRLTERGKGTPQGGVISPLLANLFLHYAFDVWMRNKYPPLPFERYADDGAPRAQRAEEGPMCVTVRPMRAGPSEPACRSRLQTTFGGCGQKPWS
jgi:RNA-directed DNA polymerase